MASMSSQGGAEGAGAPSDGGAGHGRGSAQAIPGGGPGDGRRAQRPGPRRSPAGMAVPILFAAWIVLEVWLLLLVGRVAGVLTVVALLLAGLLAGAAVIRRAGRRAWRNISATLQAGGAAPLESSGAAMAMLGGLLLMVPGFASDVLGLLCLFPPTRSLLRKVPARLLGGRRGPLADTYERSRILRPDGKVVQGEVVDREDEGTRE